MTTTFLIVTVVMLVSMCVLHILASLVFHDNLSKILNFVNIGLHILLMIPMMLAGFEIGTAVVLYMVSAFVYSLVSTVSYAIEKRRREREESEVSEV